jgi:hypothetical protein
MSAIASMVEPWNPVRYRFDGDLPVLPDSEVEVLERNLRPLNVAFSRIGEAFKDAAIDVSSFDDPSVDTITATQRTPFGYTITISLQDGSVSLNQAWEFWPHPENDCRDDACFKRYQTKLSNIPADAELIRIASAFLAEHDIDVSTYGTPIVDNAWRREYDRTSDKNTAWVPDTLRVVYPLLVDGKTVMDIGGGPSGVSVQVSVRHKRVSDVWGLSTYQFTRSKHPAISDRHDIDDFLGHAGSQTPNAPVVTLKDPSIGFIRVYTYDAGKNVELFVPALIFRITDVPNDVYVYQQTVAVPLAKDLFDEATSSMPMPLDGGPAIDIPSQDPTPIENATR